VRTDLVVSEALCARLRAVYAYLAAPSPATAVAVRVTFSALSFAVRTVQLEGRS